MLNKTKINTGNPREGSSKNVVTEEDVLKKMLGLGQIKSNAVNQTPQTVMDAPQKIDLNTLFAKQPANNVHDAEGNLPNLSSLPKPPAAWHQKSKNVHQAAMQAPPSHQIQAQQIQSHPPYLNNMSMNMGAPLMYPPHYFPPQHPNMSNMGQSMNIPYAPQHMTPHMFRPPAFVPGSNYPMPPMMGHGPVPGPPGFIQVPHHVRMAGPRPGTYVDWMSGQVMSIPHHSPEGPQKLKPKNGTSSAFIPLQAARKGVKSKSNANIATNDNDLTKKNEIAEKSQAEAAIEVFVYMRKSIELN